MPQHLYYTVLASYLAAKKPGYLATAIKSSLFLFHFYVAYLYARGSPAPC